MTNSQSVSLPSIKKRPLKSDVGGVTFHKHFVNIASANDLKPPMSQLETFELDLVHNKAKRYKHGSSISPVRETSPTD